MRNGSRVRVGIIGAGSWVTSVHLPALVAMPDVDVVAVCRREKPIADRIAATFDVPHAVTDYRDLLDMRLDAVVVASPPNVHEDHVTAALRSGAHVLCEKPFAIDPAAAWRMVDEARKAHRHLMVAFGWNHMPLMRVGRDYIGSPQFGEIEFLTVNLRVDTRPLLSDGVAYGLSAADVPPRAETFTDPSISGGGQAPVSLSHAIGLAGFLTSRPGVEVYARMSEGNSGLDIHDALVLVLEGGAIATVTAASSHASAAGVEWEIAAFGPGGQVMIDSRRGDARFAPASGSLIPASLPGNAGKYEPTGPIRELISVARGATPSAAGAPELGAHSVDVVAAAYQSAVLGTSITVPHHHRLRSSATAAQHPEIG